MAELENLMKDIEILRDKLQQLIKQKQGNLVDPDVIAASRILDATLNQYNKLLEEKLESK